MEQSNKAVELQKTFQDLALNSRTAPCPILIPDILYEIFTFAVYGSAHPGTTALRISHVCRSWRNFALECTNLWTFVDLSYPYTSRLSSSLFLPRSGKAPLTLTWTTMDDLSLFRHPVENPHSDPCSLSKSRLESHMNDILPRLHSLTLHLTYSELVQIGHLFQVQTEPSPRPQHLDVQLHSIPRSPDLQPWSSLLPINLSSLRELALDSVVLPRAPLVPVHDRLRRFALWHPVHLPTVTEILIFLSHCPHLTELRLGFTNPSETDNNASSTATEAVSLEFPNLRKLELVSTNGRSSYECVRQISASIQNLGALSSFWLEYNPPASSDGTPGSRYILPKFNDWMKTRPSDIFYLVPSKTFSYFATYRYLFIKFFRFNGEFIIYSAPDPQPSQDESSWTKPPLYISGAGRTNGSFDHTPIIALIQTMTEITHLELGYDGCEVLTSWDIDIRACFPCLTTLVLSNYHEFASDCTDLLNSLQLGFELETLVLTIHRIISPDDFVDAICRLGVQVLELRYYERRDGIDHEVIAALQDRGIAVVVN